MNSENGKLLVLGGFALRLFIAGINFFINLLSFMTPYPSFLATLFNLASICATVMIAAGFLVMFLADHDVFDFILACGFASGALIPILTLVGSRIFYNYRIIYILISSLIVLIGLVTFATLLMWAFKLYKKSNRLAAFAIVVSLGATVFSTLLTTLFGRFILIGFLSNMISLGSVAALTFAAFLQFRND
ncbi:MAG: hypothetical protein IKC61_00120 [Clostridia bacterium]|nr:hypothetical protein [Clostridia bacterium]